MANVLIEEQTMYDIADSIRNKLEVGTLFKPGEMAIAIDSIEAGVENHFCTIYLHNDDKDLIGLEISVTKPNGEVETGTINSNGECSIVVYEAGNYKVRWNTTEKTASVSLEDLFDNAVKDFKISTLEIVTFADGTDEQIAAMLEAHYSGAINIADYWAVGNKRKVHLNAMSATGVGESHVAQDVEYVIIGINHDDLATPINGITKAAVTIHMKDSLKEAGYMNSSYSGSSYCKYSASQRRTWVNNVFEKSLPAYMQTLIKPVSKKTFEYNALVSSTERCFMVSNWEVFGAKYSSYVTQQDGNQYEYYKVQSNRIKNLNGSANYWWTRTGFWYGSVAYFVVCGSDGAAYSGSASGDYGLALGLCL